MIVVLLADGTLRSGSLFGVTSGVAIVVTGDGDSGKDSAGEDSAFFAALNVDVGKSNASSLNFSFWDIALIFLKVISGILMSAERLEIKTLVRLTS